MIQLFRRDLVRDFFRNNPGNTRFYPNFKKLFSNFCTAWCCYRTSFNQSLAQPVILNYKSSSETTSTAPQALNNHFNEPDIKGESSDVTSVTK